VLRAELDLEVRTIQNTWKRITFLFDSGTEMTTMPAERATTWGLPIPKRPVRGLLFRGEEVRPGLLRARIVGLDPTEYFFPCYFLGDPNISVPDPKFLLGLTGVINQVRLTFEGIYTLAAPDGRLVVETY
jgi:hypothetical protein